MSETASERKAGSAPSVLSPQSSVLSPQFSALKFRPVPVTLADPFADVAPEVWAELGLGREPEPPPEATAAPDPLPEETPPLIEIHDEADMALASWLYLDEPPASADSPTPPPAEAAPTEAELMDWLISANKPAS